MRVFCLFLCLCTMRMLCKASEDQKSGHHTRGTGVGWCEPPSECWDPNKPIFYQSSKMSEPLGHPSPWLVKCNYRLVHEKKERKVVKERGRNGERGEKEERNFHKTPGRQSREYRLNMNQACEINKLQQLGSNWDKMVSKCSPTRLIWTAIH